MKRKYATGKLRAGLGLAAMVAGVALAATTTFGVGVDLTTPGDTTLHNLTGSYGGTALVGNFTSHPAGTGVFDPFLTLERNASGGHPAGIEGAYNTDGHSALYLDEQRPEWNTYLRFGDLARVNVGGSFYYAFELDANEPSAQKKWLLSIDNVRIYTSGGDTTGLVGNNEANLDNLGTLRWAMNSPLKDASGNYIIDNWVKLDSRLSDQLSKANGGSGWSDMILYIPESAFAGVSASDYVWFYNLNGVHETADAGTAAQAGYEEWRAVVSPQTVPDGGSALLLLGSGLGLLGAIQLRLGRRSAARKG